MPLFSFAWRYWMVGDCPADLVEYAQEQGFAPGCVMMVLGVTGDPEGKCQSVPVRLGLSEASISTLAYRWHPNYHWIAFWDPTGQMEPVSLWPIPPPPDPLIDYGDGG